MTARAPLTVDDYVKGVLAGDRTLLARAITLIESNAPHHVAMAEEVVHALLPHSGKSLRIGVTGVPGAGKSTFIEALGCRLCDRGTRLAVLAIDPSSTITRGSILGDKTRMEELANKPGCFIRPSPSGGALGGVARKTRETILLCEAAGFDTIFVETVGVGQSETTVRSMVDFFLVLLIAGAGDDLQGIKKGIVELADTLVFTKADGTNRPRVEAARAELERVLHYLTPPTPGWTPQVLAVSSLEGRGLEEVWAVIRQFHATTTASGHFEHNRRRQALDWIHSLIEQELWNNFRRNPMIAAEWPRIEGEVLAGRLSPTAAARRLLTANQTIHP